MAKKIELEKGGIYWFMDAIYVSLGNGMIQRFDDFIENQSLDEERERDQDYQYIKVGELTQKQKDELK
jgi:hypothetical protein